MPAEDPPAVKAEPPTKPVGRVVRSHNGLAVLTDRRIEITQRIGFVLNKASLLPGSAAVLDAVAQLLADNPQIAKLEVQAHGDGSLDKY